MRSWSLAIAIALLGTAPYVGAATEVRAVPLPHAQPTADGENASYLRIAASRGNPAAQFALGWMYYEGKGVARNPAMGFVWYERAAQQGHLQAQYRLGLLYMEGHGVERDSQQAAYWWERASQAGIVAAKHRLALLSLRGDKKVSANLPRALHLLHEAAQGGLPEAQADLAELYLQGTGVTRNYYDGFTWYYRAAIQGDARAQYALAIMYLDALGVSRNMRSAIRWLRAAAQQGHGAASTKLEELLPLRALPPSWLQSGRSAFG